MLTATANLPAAVYINPRATRPLARALGAIAVPARRSPAGVAFGDDTGGPSTSFYWGLALGALGMFGLMSILPK